MKTRMHRFWLSVTLAAGSLASPWSAKLSAHDLPWRWTSETVSSADWNYLRDDCLDGRTLSRYGRALSSSLDSSVGSCPAEEKFANRLDIALAERARSGIADEMACWASKWEQIQRKAGEAVRATLVNHRQEVLSKWAARPDFGVPPAPAVPIVDTCGYGAEYLAMQAAADLLDAEMARAAAISAKEAELNRALADARAIEAATIDAIAQSDLAQASASERTLCGGQSREIISQQRPHSDFAPPIDEYMAYDLDGRDAHWLGGLNKSWRLRAAIAAGAAASTDAKGNRSAAASFGADELLEDFTVDSAPRAQAAEIIEAPSDSEYALCDFVAPTASASELVAAMPDSGIAPAPIDDVFALKDRLAEGLDWLDDASCIVAAEMCGLDHAHRLGEQWGDWSLSAVQQGMTSYVAMGHYLNLPPMVYEPTPNLEPRSDIYVVYSSLSDPAHRDASLEESGFLEDELAAWDNGSLAGAKSLAKPAASPASRAADLFRGWDLAQMRRHVLSLAARQLDAFGMSCLQTADQLSNWADTQIASRDDSDVR